MSRELIERWIKRHGGKIDLAATTLGVSRRTVERWRTKGPPRAIATLLEQLENGPALTGSYWRGIVRRDWRGRI